MERPRRPDHPAGVRLPRGVRVRVADGLRVQGMDPQQHPGPGHAGGAAAIRGLRQAAGGEHQGWEGMRIQDYSNLPQIMIFNRSYTQ